MIDREIAEVIIRTVEIVRWPITILICIWILYPRKLLPTCDECCMGWSGKGFKIKRLSWLIYPWRGKIKCPEKWMFKGEKDPQYFCLKCWKQIKKDLKDA